jgi:hypothetical protein
MGIAKGNRLEVFCPDPLLDDNLIARTDAVLNDLEQVHQVLMEHDAGNKFFRKVVVDYIRNVRHMMRSE